MVASLLSLWAGIALLEPHQIICDHVHKSNCCLTHSGQSCRPVTSLLVSLDVTLSKSLPPAYSRFPREACIITKALKGIKQKQGCKMPEITHYSECFLEFKTAEITYMILT